jgi:TonB family protein
MEKTYTVFARYFFALSIVIIASCNFMPTKKDRSDVQADPEVKPLNNSSDETVIDKKDSTQRDEHLSDSLKEEYTPAGTYLCEYFPPIEDYMPSEPDDSIDLLPRIPDLGDNSDEIVDFPKCDAEYIGGQKAMMKFIIEEVRYPPIGLDCFAPQGKVYLTFVVEPDGRLTNIVVQRGVTKELDCEATRVVRAMPDWKPAINDDKPCRSRVRLPIGFELQ